MTSYHTRSLSFPSKVHPVADQFDGHMSRLRSSLAASTSSPLNQTLTNLKDLYISVDELLQLQTNQQAVSQNARSKWTEEVLDGSLRLLDICSISRDILVQSKECLQDAQSALRRRCSGELDITKEVIQYLNTRKRARKTIKNTLKTIKEAEQTTMENTIGSMLKEVNSITLEIFKSVMTYTGGLKMESQKSKWSLVSRLMHHGGDKTATITNNEFDAVDATFESIICQKKKSDVETMRRQMMKLESKIQLLDEALDSLFRHLVKTRATLLNFLSN